MAEPTTFAMAITQAPRARASRTAPSVSAVSPLCETATTTSPGPLTGSRWRNSLARSPAQRGGDRPRLLEDLLQHEVRVAVLLGLRRAPGDGLDGAVHRLAPAIADLVAAGADLHHVAFLEEDNLSRLLQDGGHVGGD